MQEVHEDYVVQEETGRIDFGYIATMNEVCREKGQHFIIKTPLKYQVSFHVKTYYLHT